MKQSNGKTVWQHEEKRWKPRTFQAAKVFFPAHDIHRPPEPVKEPVYAETQIQKMARESKERDRSYKDSDSNPQDTLPETPNRLGPPSET